MTKPKVDIKKLIDFRQKLHKFPNLSGNERPTAELVKHFVARYNPDNIIEFDNNSLAVQFFSAANSPSIVFRCELDALPLDDPPDLPYRSVNPGIAHKCGHDGHIVILIGLAEAISRTKKINGKLTLLFQAAEETLQGALGVLSDSKFKQINPDIVIGFHNIPGYEQNAILLKPQDTTAYVTGLKLTLKGKSAHAAYASQNLNILKAISQLIHYVEKEFPLISISKNADINFTHIRFGHPTFGISPDSAVIHLTLRSFDNDTLEKLIDTIEDQIKMVAIANRLQWQITYTEDAPGVFNDPQLTDIAAQIAQNLGRQLIFLDKPFPWGEDFGFYTIKYKGLYLGIGAGTDLPQLHSTQYDFPDEIIYPSIEYLYNLYLMVTEQNPK